MHSTRHWKMKKKIISNCFYLTISTISITTLILSAYDLKNLIIGTKTAPFLLLEFFISTIIFLVSISMFASSFINLGKYKKYLILGDLFLLILSVLFMGIEREISVNQLFSSVIAIIAFIQVVLNIGFFQKNEVIVTDVPPV